MLEIENVSKKIKKHQILNHISFSFQNEVYGLLGENGAGKTTLLRCIANIMDVSGGKVLWDGIPIHKYKNYQTKIGYLPQKFGVLPDLTVFEFMEFFGTLKKIEKKQMKEYIMQCLTDVGLAEYAHRKTSTLSGGMIRRLGIAQAILGDTELLLFDEATVGLDPEERIRFKNIISHIKKDKTILISTHVIDEIEQICSQILVMHKGELLGSFTVEQLKRFAENKVYEVRAGSIEQASVYCCVKQFTKNDITMERVLTYAPLPQQAVMPTLEEGYLCCIELLKK